MVQINHLSQQYHCCCSSMKTSPVVLVFPILLMKEQNKYLYQSIGSIEKDLWRREFSTESKKVIESEMLIFFRGILSVQSKRNQSFDKYQLRNDKHPFLQIDLNLSNLAIQHRSSFLHQHLHQFFILYSIMKYLFIV